MMAIVSLLGGLRATAFAAVALLALSWSGVQTWRVHSAQTDLATAQATMQKHLAADAEATKAAELAARAKEYESAISVAKVAEQYEKDKQNAKALSDSVVADLRAGTVKLRQHWAGCQVHSVVPPVAASSSGADGTADDRARGASDIVRAAANCSAQVTGLQAIVVADRK